MICCQSLPTCPALLRTLAVLQSFLTILAYTVVASCCCRVPPKPPAALGCSLGNTALPSITQATKHQRWHLPCIPTSLCSCQACDSSVASAVMPLHLLCEEERDAREPITSAIGDDGGFPSPSYAVCLPPAVTPSQKPGGVPHHLPQITKYRGKSPLSEARADRTLVKRQPRLLYTSNQLSAISTSRIQRLATSRRACSLQPSACRL